MSNDDHAILLMWVCLLLGFMLLLFCVWVVFVVVVCVCVCVSVGGGECGTGSSFFILSD